MLLIAAIIVSFASCVNEDDLNQENTLMTFASRNTRCVVERPCYPSIHEMANSLAVVTNMEIAWAYTLDACVPDSRCEFGFLIYSYGGANGIYVGNIEHGPSADNSTNPENNKGKISLKLPADKTELCGFFHTHTSYQYFDFPCFRITGPSGDDIAICNKYNISGLLYDYDADTVFYRDSKDLPYTLYKYGTIQK